jgi:hypothetical protein
MVPFMHFEPGEYVAACPEPQAPSTERAASREREFNQPSTWVVLNKSPRQLRNLEDPSAGTNATALLNDAGAVSVPSVNGLRLEMDNVGRGLAGLSPGLNALARAQTYYHRPGNWGEQPNFFNPYWRARLASVYQGRGGLPVLQQLLQALPDALGRSPQKLLVH